MIRCSLADVTDRAGALPRQGEPCRRHRDSVRDAPQRLQRRDRLAVAGPERDRAWHYSKWCRDTFAALQPYFGATRYVNYLADDESGDSAAAAAYGPNYTRLREIKSKYDPENFFRTNINVKPN